MSVAEDKLKQDREEGEYFEEVGMIADSIVDAIKEEELTDRQEVDQRLHETLNENAYACRPVLSILVLHYSKFPTAELFIHGCESGTEWDGGKKAFPFGRMAFSAMLMDIMAELEKRPEYAALPQHAPEDDDGEGEEAEG